ncbi:MAG: hypothetical protein GKR86_02000 [Ilumatobacter sp.]|nr:hypothetical protein [Ilumatobacter sp.]
MFTTGSKFLIGASAVALLATVIYGVGQDGVLGTIGLASATVGLMALTALNAILRDSNVFLDDDAPVENTAAAQPAPTGSVWPFGFASGAVVVAVGLVSYQPVVVIGVVVLLATGAEWTVHAWAERASSDGVHNAKVRSRLSNPLEYPIGGAVALGIIIYGFSRIILSLGKTNTTVAFFVAATVVVVVGFMIASRPKLGSAAVGSVMAVGAIAVVAAGTVTGIRGERDIAEFETTTIWQEEALLHPEEYAAGAAEGKHPAGLICESPEEFPEADERASETVGMKSGTYQVLLSESGTLDFDPPGEKEAGAVGMVIPRSSTTNVIFRNDSDEHRRLSLDLGRPYTVTDYESEIGNLDESAPPTQICTTLIEPGGAQLLTFKAGEPSFAYESIPNPNGPPGADGFWFFVPGVDTAKLELIVP